MRCPQCMQKGNADRVVKLLANAAVLGAQALLLHPSLLGSTPQLEAWPKSWAMLEEGRRPGVCSWAFPGGKWVKIFKIGGA